MKETLISFCIVNLNAKNHLISCLKSISMSTKYDFFEIIVVDNNSNDGSIDLLRHQYPEVKLIINLRNYGYTKAINQALRLSKGKYKVVLNPDTELMPKSIDIMINYMKSSKNIGIVGPKVLNKDGSFQKS